MEQKSIHPDLRGGLAMASSSCSGLIDQAIGFPMEMFPVLFAIPRTSGWLAQWQEMRGDPEQKIARPRQIYLGSGQRGYLGIGKRDDAMVAVT
jgi:citrate synthase